MRLQCSNIGWCKPTESLQYITNELAEVGVQLNEDQLQELLDKLMTFHNHSHLWCNRGWTPDELHKQTMGQDTPIISLGPGIQKAIAEGKLDLEEVKRELGKRGIRIID